MKINNPMTYFLAPLVIIGVIVLSILKFTTNLFDGTPVYFILMCMCGLIAVIVIIGEILFSKKGKMNTMTMSEYEALDAQGLADPPYKYNIKFEEPKEVKSAEQKKFRKIVLLSTVITIAVIGGFVALCMWNMWIGVPVFLIFCFGSLFLALSKDKKEATVQKQETEILYEIYGDEQAPRFHSFYFGLSYWDKGEFNIETVKEGVKIISGSTIEIPAYVLEDGEKQNQKAYISDYILEKLEESEYGVNVDIKSELEDLVWNINRVIKKKNLYLNELTKEQITPFDDEYMKARRSDSIATMSNDINIIHDIISKQGYELINIISDEYCLTIVSPEEFDELKKIEI